MPVTLMMLYSFFLFFKSKNFPGWNFQNFVLKPLYFSLRIYPLCEILNLMADYVFNSILVNIIFLSKRYKSYPAVMRMMVKP